ncbi:hypothetical protein EVAR_57841_1 [Eumeta japonica]|uniref:Uncharacterized protein n=1 Tax=Eumeta variegata TaxID=151549 RepID=A0A4C1YVX1_EUMVA|nr:hypothetical protein EVAR_57841_1 [Eumeta japonica]
MTSQLALTLRGHGGFEHYLFRLKLKDSRFCACYLAKIQNVLYVVEKCHMFLRERPTSSVLTAPVLNENGEWTLGKSIVMV